MGNSRHITPECMKMIFPTPTPDSHTYATCRVSPPPSPSNKGMVNIHDGYSPSTILRLFTYSAIKINVFLSWMIFLPRAYFYQQWVITVTVLRAAQE